MSSLAGTRSPECLEGCLMITIRFRSMIWLWMREARREVLNRHGRGG